MYTYYVYNNLNYFTKKTKLDNKENAKKKFTIAPNLTRAHCFYCTAVLFFRTVTDGNGRPYRRNTVVDTDTVERNSGGRQSAVGGAGGWRTESASAAALCAVGFTALRLISSRIFFEPRGSYLFFRRIFFPLLFVWPSQRDNNNNYYY